MLWIDVIISFVGKIDQSKSKAAKGIVWDLSDLYDSSTDPKVKKDKTAVLELVDRLETAYRGKLEKEDLAPETLLQFFKDYEFMQDKWYRIGLYSSCLFDKDTQNPEYKKFYQEMIEFDTAVSSRLLWAELELTKLSDESVSKLLKNSGVKSGYSEYLRRIRTFKPFRLSEDEEEILSKKSQTSSAAFIRLYDEVGTGVRYKVKIGGEVHSLNYAKLDSEMRTNPERKVRKACAESMTRVLKSNAKVFTYILNTLLLDKKVTDEIRGYKYPQQSTFLSYAVDKTVVDSLVKTVVSNYRICERFYKLKSQVLKEGKLYEWDRYTPIYFKENRKVTWSQAKKLILEAFDAFSPTFAEIAREFFDKGWIDAEITENKWGGAYCHGSTPAHHPLILMNFNGYLDDVGTLAHELGHGIHDCLAKGNNIFQYHPSTAVAEIASIFAESLVFEKIYGSTSDKAERINLLGKRIQHSFASIFRQTAFYLYEIDVHVHRREKGELTTEEFCTYFQKRLSKMFGDGLKLTEGHKFWWSPIHHFYHYNFYVFTYTFGEALTYSLVAKYKKDGPSFVPKYISALSLGGSKTPKEICEALGVDIADPNFWEGGLSLLAEEVNEFERLVS